MISNQKPAGRKTEIEKSGRRPERRSREKTGALSPTDSPDRIARPWKIGPMPHGSVVAAASPSAGDGCHVTKPSVSVYAANNFFFERDMASSGHE